MEKKQYTKIEHRKVVIDVQVSGGHGTSRDRGSKSEDERVERALRRILTRDGRQR